MRRLETRLDGPLLIEPTVHRDERGFFLEAYRRSAMAELGVDAESVQENHSRSTRGVVRGMHYQAGMDKLVRCARGAILDVVVDIRRGSPTFGYWEAFELNDENMRQLLAPAGFGHGFCVVSEVADVLYMCSAYYDPELEGAFAYDDPEIGIAWPAGLELSPSARDAAAPLLSEISDRLPFSYRS